MIPSQKRPSPIAMPLAIICFSVLLIAAVFLVDDWLTWLGWRFLQRAFDDYTGITLLMLIIPAAVTWRITINHHEIDHMDLTGLLIGCVFGGLLLAFYTIFPPAGLVTYLIFVGIALFVFVFAPRPNWVMILTCMTIAFAAMSIFISGWLYTYQTPLGASQNEKHMYHFVNDLSQAAKGKQIQLMYECNAYGLFCVATRERVVDFNRLAHAAPPEWVDIP